jgi:hypothetical protein
MIVVNHMLIILEENLITLFKTQLMSYRWNSFNLFNSLFLKNRLIQQPIDLPIQPINIGFEERDGMQYAKYKFGDLENLLPKDLAKSKIKLASAVEISTATTPPEEISNTKKILDIIKEHLNYSVDMLGFDNLDENSRKRLSKLLREAQNMSAVFRGDFRHPFARSEMDKNIGYIPNEKGIFFEGFVPTSEKYGPGIYTSPSLLEARSYPRTEDLPSSWDQTSFLYIIDPREIIEEMEPPEDETLPGIEAYPEFNAKTIPAESTFAAIEYNKATSHYIRSYKNALFGKPDLVKKLTAEYEEKKLLGKT